ncbi:MAG: AIR synthase family protein [Thermoproteus sp. AZ2]|jgi:hydrogenase expression/formation protein HypE|uniref:AIR synthase family protein n=1 Tax=Thermoproteus sp. AZ2 TaxID=1609232 RepID=A0ACC6V1Q8_9CREN|nr:MAG: hydrogenase assembly protein HupF [Thermoproteus sp. AZ2]
MKVGKLPVDIVRKYIYNRTGAYDPAVLVGPSIGEDAAIIRSGGSFTAMHVDPISGSIGLLGWLAIHVPSNDIAVRGVRPRWAMTTIFLPPTADEGALDAITAQMDAAARELGVAIVGGHTEVTTAVARPLVVTSVIGVGERYISTGGAKPGDLIIMTKSAALEAAAILATDFKDEMRRRGVPEEALERAAGFIRQVSAVKEALALADLADSMHDPTEGGILGGLVEMAYASNASIEIDPAAVPIAEEALMLCKAAGLDPLATLSSGALLAAVPPERLKEAERRLGALGLRAAVIGKVAPRTSYLVKAGSLELTEPYIRDRFFELFA